MTFFNRSAIALSVSVLFATTAPAQEAYDRTVTLDETARTAPIVLRASNADYRGRPAFDRHGHTAPLSRKIGCAGHSGTDYRGKPPFDRDASSNANPAACAEQARSTRSARKGGPRHHYGKRYR